MTRKATGVIGLVALLLLMGVSLFVGVMNVSPKDLWHDPEAMRLDGH